MNECHNPIFIGGCARSGTTALWHALVQHPHLTPAPNKWPDKELWFFAEFFEGRDLNNTARRYHELDQQFEKEAVEFINGFMTRYCSSAEGRYITAYIHNIYYAHEILKHLPDAKFLFVVRHPQETVWSLLNAFFAAGYIRKNKSADLITAEEITKATQLWKKSAKVVLESLRGELGNSAKVIRHEQMVTQPVITIQEILEFVELPFLSTVADCLAKEVINSSFTPGKMSSESSFHYIYPVENDHQRLNYFERTRAQVAARQDICAIVRTLAAEEMQLLGYEDYASQIKQLENAEFSAPIVPPPAVELVKIIVVDQNGLIRHDFEPDKQVILKVTIRANEAVSNLSLSFVVWDEEQNHLFGTTTFDENVVLPELKPAEELEVAFQFASGLRLGEYHVAVAVNSVSDKGYRDNILHHQIDDAGQFRVLHSPHRPIHYKFHNQVNIEFARGKV